MANAAAVIVTVKTAGGTGLLESRTVTWNVKEPAALGVPEMIPEDARVTPPGRLPPVNCQVYVECLPWRLELRVGCADGPGGQAAARYGQRWGADVNREVTYAVSAGAEPDWLVPAQ